MCPNLCGQAIESRSTAPGIADVWFGPCPVECKYLRRYPVKPSTPVNLEHELTVAQYRWLNKRYDAGFPAWVVLQANKVEWLLFAAPDSYVLAKGHAVPRRELYQYALKMWMHGLVPAEIEETLRYGITMTEWLRHDKGLSAKPKVKL